MADGIGQYRGSSAEISGQGFAGMVFTAKSVSSNDFTTWVSSVKQSPQILTYDSFKKLSQPSVNNPSVFYSSTQDNLFTTIVMQYMSKPMNMSETMMK